MAEKKATLLIEIKDAATAALEKIKDSTKGLTDVYFGLKLSFEAVEKTVGKVIGVLQESLRSWGENEAAVHRLNLALKNQGNLTASYSQKLIDLSQQLKPVTTSSE